MTAAILNDLVIEQGQDFIFKTTYAEDDANRTPINLTGGSVKMQGREAVESETLIFDLYSPSNGIVIDAVNGVITATIPASITKDITANSIIWDMVLTTSSNEKTRLWQGIISVSKGVTRI